MDISPFTKRRARLMKHMGRGIAVIPTAPEQVRNRDTQHPYRSDSYFHYLTGFGEPEAVLILVAGETHRSILFCRDKDPERDVWDGFRWGPDAAREAFGCDEAHSIKALDGKLAELFADQPSLWFSLGQDSAWDGRIATAPNVVRAQERAGKQAPAEIRDVRATLDGMRLVKDASEIAIMRRVATISAAAHRRAMRATRPGRHEYEIEAELLHEFRIHGCQAPAYSSIVAGGANACTLHYVLNNQRLRDGDLVLIDAGGELDSYASDITRTFPVNGRFSGAQADVYSLVLDAGPYKNGEAWKPLQPGMVLTVEPGCYIRAADDVPSAFHDIAVRIEDDALVTESGCEILTHEAPKTIADIELLMRESRNV